LTDAIVGAMKVGRIGSGVPRAKSASQIEK